MLYDPKWKVTTKPDIYALPTLIAWLERQPPHKEYDWADCEGVCLLDQFLTAHGVNVNERGADDHMPYVTLVNATGWDVPIAFQQPHTFGAALDRARAFLAHAE